ncbi:MAG: DUF6265 family protein [Litorimonas sp.]
MKIKLSSLGLLGLLFVSGVAHAAEAPEVRFASADHVSPPATLEDMDWFEGYWTGTVFGGPVEHSVMPAHDDHMPGLVRLRSGETDAVFLYELSSFSEVDGSLTYRNRLFDPALETSGEDETVTDRSLIAVEDGVVYFDGITFASDGPDRAIVTFILMTPEGRSPQHVVRYERVGADRP